MATLDIASGDDFQSRRAQGQAARTRGDRQAALTHLSAAQALMPDNLANNFDIASLLRELGHHDQAAQAYQKILAGTPRHVGSLRGLGLIERARGSRDKAIEWFVKAGQADPAAVQVKLDLAFELRAMKENQAADDQYEAVLALQPTNADALRGRAQVARENGRRLIALDYLRRAAQVPTVAASIHHEIATELRELGRLDEARESYSKVIAALPDHGPAWRGLGLIAAAQSRFDEAVECLQTARTLLPEVPGVLIDISDAMQRAGRSADLELLWEQMEKIPTLRSTAQLQRALAARAAGHLESVVAHLEQAIALDPRNIHARQMLASELRQRRRFSEAHEQYASILEMNPNQIPALIGSAQLKAEQGDRPSALSMLQRARDAAPENNVVALEIAGMLSDDGHYLAARELIDDVLKRSPNDLKCLMKLGQIERSRGDYAAALAAFAAAASAHPDHLLAYVEQAKEQYRLGESKSSRRLLNKVLAADPDHVEALSQMAAQHQSAGDEESAYRCFLRAYELRPSSYWLGLAAASIAATVLTVADAEALIAKIMQNEIASPAAKMQLGNLYRSLARLPESEAMLTQAFAEAPSRFDIWTSLVRLEIQLGRYENAEKLIASIPQQKAPLEKATVEFIRGELKLAAWRPQEAIGDFNRGLAIFEPDPAAHNNLAICAILSFQTALADRHLGRWSQLNSPSLRARGASANRTQSLFGQIVDEMRVYQSTNDLLESILRDDSHKRFAGLVTSVREEPENTAASLLMMIELRRLGRLSGGQGMGGHAVPMEIPKRIVQFWQSPTSEPDILALMDEWRDKNPDYAYERYDATSALEFIRKNCTAEVASAFIRAKELAQKSDVFRLAYLEKRGGIYVDADDRCLQPIRSLKLEGCELFGFMEHIGSLANNVLAVVPGHRVIAEALRRCVEAINRGDLDIIWLMTGPGLLTRAFVTEFVAAGDDNGNFLDRVRILDRPDIYSYVGIHSLARYKRSERNWARIIGRRSQVTDKTAGSSEAVLPTA